jgi:alpha-tubulin suppressor-like RCC1 family protein
MRAFIFGSVKWTHQQCTRTYEEDNASNVDLVLLASPPLAFDIPCFPRDESKDTRECFEQDYESVRTPCVNERQAMFTNSEINCTRRCPNLPTEILDQMSRCSYDKQPSCATLPDCDPNVQSIYWYHPQCVDKNRWGLRWIALTPFTVVDIACREAVDPNKVGYTSLTEALEAGLSVTEIRDLQVHFSIANVLSTSTMKNRGANSVWAMGNNANSQLGFPPKPKESELQKKDRLGGIFVANSVPTPTRIPALDQVLFQSACNGETHACLATDTGDLYCMGSNYNGQHGQNDYVDRTWPAFVSPMRKIGSVKSVACGNGFTVVITENGTGYCMGANGNGEQAHGDTKMRPVPMAIDFPQPVEAGATAPPKPIFNLARAGQSHVLALTTTGELWGWGLNDWGQLGLGDQETRFMPVMLGWFVRRKIRIAKVECGDAHSLAIDSDGNLYTWGLNFNGQLGLGDTQYRVWPVLLEPAPPAKWRLTSIAAGAMHSLAVTDAGQVLAWGSNREGQLGQNISSDFLPSTRPRAVPRLPVTRETTVHAGAYVLFCQPPSNIRCERERNAAPPAAARAFGHAHRFLRGLSSLSRPLF